MIELKIYHDTFSEYSLFPMHKDAHAKGLEKEESFSK